MDRAPSPADLTAALRQSPAYHSLAPHQQAEMADSLSRVLGFLGDAPARPFAPDFGALRGGSPAPVPATTPATGTAPTDPAAAAPKQNAFQRAAGATKEMLGAIAFPDFTASLIQGTFQAIVDSSIQQMEAYSRLLAETAKTVDQFMADNISDDMARDHLTNNHGDVFQKDLSSGRPAMTIDTGSTAQLPSFLRDLGFDSAMDLDAEAVDQVVIPETRRTLAEMRHQSLATMVMMGINRIVVSDGEINAKLVFHIDATESMTLTFNDYKPTNWTLAGKLGGNSFGASGLVVNTMTTNAQSDVNMNADLTGEVRVRFRSDYFPLERFADSAAIQLINSHAKVAQPLPASAAVPAPATAAPGAVAPDPAAPAATATAARAARRGAAGPAEREAQMIRVTLAQTLIALAEGACPPHDHLTVEEAEILLPLLLTVERGRDGPTVIAHPPYSAFRAGIEPVAHRARIVFASLDHPARPTPSGAATATPPAMDAPDRRR